MPPEDSASSRHQLHVQQENPGTIDIPQASATQCIAPCLACFNIAAGVFVQLILCCNAAHIQTYAHIQPA
eukprot:1152724-Pelagomonas_calceolata.AAC.3